MSSAWSDRRIAKLERRERLRTHHYTWKHALISWISVNLFDSATYTVRHGLLKGMKRKGGLGWLPPPLAPGLETAEQRFWEGLPLRGMVIYDIGAFQGLLTLFFASRAKEVVSFEPNGQNHQRLVENLNLNHLKNVSVYKVGLGSRDEIRKMVANPLMSGKASVDERAIEGLLRVSGKTSVEDIPIVPLDDEISRAALPAPDLVKIDIEGWELEALRGAANTLKCHQPKLFLEMHGETLAEKKNKVAEIVDFLWRRNYRSIFHIETEGMITPENVTSGMEGHLYCQIS